MLFTDRTGEGVEIEPAPRRLPFRLDIGRKRLIRAHTWQTYMAQGFAMTRIGEIFNTSVSTIKADLEYLRAEVAEHGRD